jgi:hypothetical protein
MPHHQLDIFHNTIGLDPAEAARQGRINGYQSEQILKFFRSNPRYHFTPFDVAIRTGLRAPITSIRRAITDLTRSGYLVKTERMKIGQYGMPNHTWKLR